MNKFSKAVLNHLKNVDWVILIPCMALSALSVLLLAGLLQTEYVEYLKINSRQIQSQIIAICIGIAAAMAISIFNFRYIVESWKLYVPAAYAVFFLTFIFGVATPERPDAKRWLIVPFVNMSLQPSEFLKIAFILSFAYHVYKLGPDANKLRHVILLGLHGLFPVALVQIQGDSGTAMLFGFIFLSVLFAAGIKWRYIIAAITAAGVSLPVIWFYILNEFQKNRIISLINNSEADALGYGYQQARAEIAIGSGRLWGNGIFSYNHTYVPEMHNDFIFAFIGDSLGFIGCVSVIIVLLLICSKILINAAFCPDKRGQIICAGIFSMIFFQASVNIGMCLSLLPVIGNSLPFLSSGGSSALANYVGIGLVLSVYRHSKKKKSESFLPAQGFANTV